MLRNSSSYYISTGFNVLPTRKSLSNLVHNWSCDHGRFVSLDQGLLINGVGLFFHWSKTDVSSFISQMSEWCVTGLKPGIWFTFKYGRKNVRKRNLSTVIVTCQVLNYTYIHTSWCTTEISESFSSWYFFPVGKRFNRKLIMINVICLNWITDLVCESLFEELGFFRQYKWC